MMKMRVMAEMMNLICEKRHCFYKNHILKKNLQARDLKFAAACDGKSVFFTEEHE